MPQFALQPLWVVGHGLGQTSDETCKVKWDFSCLLEQGLGRKSRIVLVKLSSLRKIIKLILFLDPVFLSSLGTQICNNVGPGKKSWVFFFFFLNCGLKLHPAQKLMLKY